MAPEDRCPVIPAARMTARDVPAVLAEAPPQRSPARRGQRMGTHADDPVSALCANLTGLVEEIDALPRPAITSVGIAQTPRPVHDLSQLAKRHVEPLDNRSI